MDNRQRRGSLFRYRRIAPSSTADDSLFKSAAPPFDKGSLYVTGRDTAIKLNCLFSPKTEEVRESSETEGERSNRNCATLSYEDLQEIKRLKELDSASRAKALDDELEERVRRAHELRRRLQAIDEEKRKRDINSSSSNKGLCSYSQYKREKEINEENREEVREMNSIILKCKVDAIRNKQIQMKRQAAEEHEKLQRELDLLMETERQKNIKELEEKEKEKIEKLRMQRTILKQQIAERQMKRELEMEERDRERELILRQTEALKLQDEIARRQKEETARNLQLEVNAHNQLLLNEKKQREALEKLEEERIMEYNREKYLREKEQEERKLQLEAEKQKGYRAICEKQDREIDKAAQLDALRARRAMEERERKERQQEEALQQKQKAIQEELAAARLQQHREKLLKLVETAVAERKEYDRVTEAQKQIALQEAARREAEKQKRMQHMRDLRMQIEQKKNEIEILKRRQMKEAEALRLAEEESKKALERTRDRKLAELEKLTDADKYISQLRRICAK